MLLAEDNEINRIVAVRMLEKHGFRVDVAVNGRVALEMCRAGRYKAVFMDCHMPELDGYETSLEIRRREGPGHHLPIIAMTANTMKGDREQCLAAGMDDHVGKPVDADALEHAIARSTERGRCRARARWPRGWCARSRPGGVPLTGRSPLRRCACRARRCWCVEGGEGDDPGARALPRDRPAGLGAAAAGHHPVEHRDVGIAGPRPRLHGRARVLGHAHQLEHVVGRDDLADQLAGHEIVIGHHHRHAPAEGVEVAHSQVATPGDGCARSRRAAMPLDERRSWRRREACPPWPAGCRRR